MTGGVPKLWLPAWKPAIPLPARAPCSAFTLEPKRGCRPQYVPMSSNHVGLRQHEPPKLLHLLHPALQLLQHRPAVGLRGALIVLPEQERTHLHQLLHPLQTCTVPELADEEAAKDLVDGGIGEGVGSAGRGEDDDGGVGAGVGAELRGHDEEALTALAEGHGATLGVLDLLNADFLPASTRALTFHRRCHC